MQAAGQVWPPAAIDALTPCTIGFITFMIMIIKKRHPTGKTTHSWLMGEDYLNLLLDTMQNSFEKRS